MDSAIDVPDSPALLRDHPPWNFPQGRGSGDAVAAGARAAGVGRGDSEPGGDEIEQEAGVMPMDSHRKNVSYGRWQSVMLCVFAVVYFLDRSAALISSPVSRATGAV